MGLMNLFNIFMQAVSKQTTETNVVETKQPERITTPIYTFHVADLAAKYETSNRGPGYISDGSKWGDPGGDSYGSYQIETKQGTMTEYLKTNDKYTKELNAYPINSKLFRQCWVELAVKDPNGFQQSQFDFLCKKKNGYNDSLTYTKKLGWDTDSFAMQSALFSTSNQSGGWRNIIDKAYVNIGDDTEVQINKLYTSRALYFKSLKSLTNKIKESIMQQRCGRNLDMTMFNKNNELLDCLKLV